MTSHIYQVKFGLLARQCIFIRWMCFLLFFVDMCCFYFSFRALLFSVGPMQNDVRKLISETLLTRRLKEFRYETLLDSTP